MEIVHRDARLSVRSEVAWMDLDHTALGTWSSVQKLDSLPQGMISTRPLMRDT